MPARTPPDPETLLRELAAFGQYPQTETGAMDAYRDFRAVFLEDDRSRRVLSQILAWSHIMGSTADPDPYQMAILNGERNLGLRVLATVEMEPAPRPKRRTPRSEK